MIEYEKLEKIRFNDDLEKTALNPDMDYSFSFNMDKVEENKNYTLRLIGQSDYPKEHRCESYFPLYYRKLDDSLYGQEDDLRLKISCKNEQYDRGFYYKISSNEIGFESAEAKISIDVSTKNKILNENSEFVLSAEIFYKKTNPSNYYDSSDETIVLDLKDACETNKTFSKSFKIIGEIDFIMIHLNVVDISGEIEISAPEFQVEGKDIMNKFERDSDLTKGRYLGDGLSKSEWPLFEIHINENLIYKGEKFERIYTNPAFEFDIEKGILNDSDNILNVKIINNKSIPRKFFLEDIELLSYYSDFQILACPDIITVEQKFPVIIQTDKENSEVIINFDGKTYNEIFELKGINYFELKTEKVSTDIELCISCENETRGAVISRSIIKEEDKVITGTSDAIFIDQNIPDFKKFLLWYVNNRIGNFITFRPSYRWSGSFISEENVWEYIRNFCESAHLYFAHMIDGRELNGCNANPESKWLESEYFLGTQCHENDGSYNYWGANEPNCREELFLSVFSRKMKHYGIFPTKTPVIHRNGISKFIDPYIAKDMKDGSEYFCNNISLASVATERHSGPSALFKYFYKSGMKYLILESMYQANELALAFLRGASKAYHKENYGVHIAIQWSTVPHDDIYRYRRFMLVLFQSYMLGASQINTEEGLWRLEDGLFDFERFCPACLNHKMVQQKFYEFVQTHSRRGKNSVDFAVLHGKHDAYTLFTKQNSWAQIDEKWQYSEMEDSWDLLKIFYPNADFDAIYHPETEFSKWGFFTGMPYGDLDIVPVEADCELLEQYKFIFMLGNQSLEENDLAKFIQYVRNGGILLFGLPHLFISYDKQELLSAQSDIIDSELLQELIGAQIDKTSVFDTKEAHITNLKDSTQHENVILHKLGNGKVIFVNSSYFPANPNIRDVYEKYIRILSDEVMLQNNSSITSQHYVSSSRFINDDTVIYYLLNVNWWDENETENALLSWGNEKFNLSVNRDYMAILTMKDQISVLTNDNETDIISIDKNEDGYEIILQGNGVALLKIYSLCDVEIYENQPVEMIENEKYIKTIKICLNGLCTIKLKSV
jgi:hypothetical protein